MNALKYFLFVVSITVVKSVKICVPDGAKDCLYLNGRYSFTTKGLQCVAARDRAECLQKILDMEADITVTSNSELYLSHLIDPTNFMVVAETRTENEMSNRHRYEGVAVIKRSRISTLDDLKGSKSCHTGYYRTAGWHIPISSLKSKGMMNSACDPNLSVVEQDLFDASNFFEEACIPGPWAPDGKETDNIYREKYSNLCKLCASIGDKHCSSKDAYAGYVGALKCLTDWGDVAWTKYSEVVKYFEDKETTLIESYGLLCPDGRILDIKPGYNDVSNCAWAGRPWNTWVVRTDDQSNSDLINTVSEFLKDDKEAFKFINTEYVFGFKNTTKSIIKSVAPLIPKNYLEDANYLHTLTNITCDKAPLSMCVKSKDEMDKCSTMSKVMKASRVRPELNCVMPEIGDKNCLAFVERSDSVIVTVDGGEAYKGHKVFGTRSIISEKYGDLDASYYAVAIIKANSNIKSFADLKGKKSCHTHIGRTSGWKMPTAILMEKGLLNKNNGCEYEKEFSEFFSESCVPGVKDTNRDISQSTIISLCKLCIGDGKSEETKCRGNSDERYEGYAGAFRCLVEKGDVAFAKHMTVPSNTDGNNDQDWAKDLSSDDFRLLCPDGTTAKVTDYRKCNLERVPAHSVIIGGGASETTVEEARIMLLRASSSVKLPTFLLFGIYNEKSNLLFKDSATELINIPMDDTHTAIEQNYHKKIDEYENCGASKTTDQNTATNNAGSILIVLPLCIYVLKNIL